MRSDFCWSCGALVGPLSGSPCPKCSAERDLPRWEGHALLGREVTFRSGLAKHQGLVIEESAQDVLVVSKSGTQQLSATKVERVASQDNLSGAYRLYAAGKPDQASRSLTDLASRRAFAADAVAAQDQSALSISGLTATEQAWLSMWLAFNSGMLEVAADLALQLPATSYPDKLVPLLASCSYWLNTPSSVQCVSRSIEHFDSEPASEVLRFALAQSPHLDEFRSAIRQIEVGIPGFETNLASKWTELVSSDSWLQSDVVSNLDTVAARSLTLLEASSGSSLPSLTDLSRQVLDTAVDQGSLRSEHLQNPAVVKELSEDSLAYLKARLAPDTCTDKEIRLIGDNEELRRRVFLGLIREQLPHSQELWAQRYLLLDQLRSGDPRVLGDLIPLLPESHRPAALALGFSLSSKQVMPAAAQDPTTWNTLSEIARSQSHDEHSEPVVIDMLGWTLLAGAMDALFLWDWENAYYLAERCYSTVGDEPRLDEAMNIMASAAWMNGDYDVSARWLAEAVEGNASPSLLVNFAFVTQFSDPVRSINTLERLIQEGCDAPLARNAAIVATERMKRVSDSNPLPTPHVRATLRGGAVQNTPLAEHLRILSLLKWADQEWVQDPRNTESSRHASSLEHRLAVAEENWPDAVIDLLAAELPRSVDNQLLLHERDKLVNGIINVLRENEEPLPWLAFRGFEVLDRKIPLELPQEIQLPVLSVRECLFDAQQNYESPVMPPEMLQRVEKAEQLLSASPQVDPGDSWALISSTYELWAETAAPNWRRRVASIFEHFNNLIDWYNSNLSEIYYEDDLLELQEELHQVFMEILANIEVLWADIGQVRRHIHEGAEISEEIDSFTSDLSSLFNRMRDEIS
jgi:hypothetical protein